MQKTQTHHLTISSTDAKPQTVDQLELISAYFDGEFEQSGAEQLPGVLPLAEDIDPLEHKADWALYALIADSLAQPAARALNPSDDFSARLSAALQREPAHQPVLDTAAAQSQRSPSPVDLKPSSLWSRWLSWPSLAMAAAVAAVVWVAQPLLMLDEAVVVATPTVVTQPSVVTQPPVDGRIVSDYANAHRQFSGPIAVRQASFEPEVER